jgi:hypothetical protein
MERPYLQKIARKFNGPRTFIFIFISLLILHIFPCSLHAWELAKDANNIKIYTRDVEGSKFKEYKGTMEIEASLSALVALVDDIAAHPSWIHTGTEGRLLKRVSQKESFTYSINGAPWPVSDRDAVVRNYIQQDPATLEVTITITAFPNYIPEEPGLMRVRKINGYWYFNPLTDGRVQVIYQVHNEPGGKIPSWLVNSIVITQPYHTLKNMKKMVRLQKYRQAKYDFIKEAR